MYLALRKEFNALNPSTDDQNPKNTVDNVESYDIHNSDMFSSDAQHAPIVQWFKAKNITANPSVNAVDTTGFFDEAAVAIGTDYALLGEVCDRIRYAQLKEFSSNVVYLDKKSKEEAKAIQAFIQQLYEHSLIARFISNSKEKIYTSFCKMHPVLGVFSQVTG